MNRDREWGHHLMWVSPQNFYINYYLSNEGSPLNVGTSPEIFNMLTE